MKSLPKNKRIACLWFPNWPVQRLLAARPELGRTVLLLTETTGHGEFVSFGNSWACRRGISAGMPLAEAQSLVHRRDVVHFEPMQPEADRIALGEAYRDSLHEFIHCLGILSQRYPAMFHSKAQQLLPCLTTRLSQLAAALDDDDKQTDATKERCRRLADCVRLQFPNQQVNWIYKSLRRTHVRLRELVSTLKIECKQRGCSFCVRGGAGIALENAVVIRLYALSPVTRRRQA